MKLLTVIVLIFAVLAYDVSYNDGQLMLWVALSLGLR
jgi:hypothetical protein